MYSYPYYRDRWGTTLAPFPQEAMRLISNSIFGVSLAVSMGGILHYILSYNGIISALLGEVTYCVGV